MSLQLSFTLQGFNRSDIIARSSEYTTVQDCEIRPDNILCIFRVNDTVQGIDLEITPVRICSVEVFTLAALGSPPQQKLITVVQQDGNDSLTVNGMSSSCV